MQKDRRVFNATLDKWFNTPEEFYDSSLVAELDKSGFLANPK